MARAKEAAEREKDEAIRIAHAIFEENKKLKGSVNQGQTVLLEQAKKVINNEIEWGQKINSISKVAFPAFYALSLGFLVIAFDIELN